jgi:hypothetical protein
MLRDEELASSVQSKDLVEHLLGNIFLAGEALHSGVVDHNVQSSVMRHRGIEQLGHFASFADVGLNGNCPATL